MESTIYLNNIKCNGCVQGVKNSLSNISGIDDLNIDIPTGKLTMNHQDSLSLDQVLETLDEAGYPEK